MTTVDSSAVEALGWALVHFAWQGALAGALFAVLDLGLRGSSPRLRYALAASTLAAMALTPPLTFLATRTGAPDAASRGVTPTAAREPPPRPRSSRARRPPPETARPSPCASASRAPCPPSWACGARACSRSPCATWAAGGSSSGWIARPVRSRPVRPRSGWPVWRDACASPGRCACWNRPSWRCPPSWDGCARRSSCPWRRWPVSPPSSSRPCSPTSSRTSGARTISPASSRAPWRRSSSTSRRSGGCLTACASSASSAAMTRRWPPVAARSNTRVPWPSSRRRARLRCWPRRRRVAHSSSGSPAWSRPPAIAVRASRGAAAALALAAIALAATGVTSLRAAAIAGQSDGRAPRDQAARAARADTKATPQAAPSPRPRATPAAATDTLEAKDTRPVPIERVIELAGAGVTPEYIDEMAALGHPSLSWDQLIALRSQGVSAQLRSRHGRGRPCAS